MLRTCLQARLCNTLRFPSRLIYFSRSLGSINSQNEDAKKIKSAKSETKKVQIRAEPVQSMKRQPPTEKNSDRLEQDEIDKTTLTDKNVESLYEKKSPVEHILLRPDTYVGSTQPHTQMIWVINPATNKMEEKNITFIPALLKLFDEILVNAADNKQRCKSMKEIRVDIDEKNLSIKIKNDGKGIPIIYHEKYDCYIPQLIFGNLLTGSNFNDSIAKVTGGRNGYGAVIFQFYSIFHSIYPSFLGYVIEIDKYFFQSIYP